MAHFYPIYLQMENRSCLVIGGGKVAERKIISLLEHGACIKVVSPRVEPTISDLDKQGLISWCRREFVPTDLECAFLVFIATNDSETNRNVAHLCRERGILVNAVDDPPNCDFYVPAVLRRQSLSLAISTEGKSPLLAGKLRKELETIIGEEYGELVEIMGEQREKVKNSKLGIEQREKIFASLINSDILALLKTGNREKVEERIGECMSFLQD